MAGASRSLNRLAIGGEQRCIKAIDPDDCIVRRRAGFFILCCGVSSDRQGTQPAQGIDDDLSAEGGLKHSE